MTQMYDITLSIHDDNSSLSLEFKFNSGYIKKEGSTKLTNSYIQLVKLLLDEFSLNEGEETN
jgi:hypothetical protein